MVDWRLSLDAGRCAGLHRDVHDPIGIDDVELGPGRRIERGQRVHHAVPRTRLVVPNPHDQFRHPGQGIDPELVGLVGMARLDMAETAGIVEVAGRHAVVAALGQCFTKLEGEDLPAAATGATSEPGDHHHLDTDPITTMAQTGIDLANEVLDGGIDEVGLAPGQEGRDGGALPCALRRGFRQTGGHERLVVLVDPPVIRQLGTLGSVQPRELAVDVSLHAVDASSERNAPEVGRATTGALKVPAQEVLRLVQVVLIGITEQEVHLFLGPAPPGLVLGDQFREPREGLPARATETDIDTYFACFVITHAAVIQS